MIGIPYLYSISVFLSIFVLYLYSAFLCQHMYSKYGPPNFVKKTSALVCLVCPSIILNGMVQFMLPREMQNLK